jgi:mannose-6-phosphate isomerase-like protein (cupin superfamily)
MKTTLVRTETKNFEKADEVRTFDKGRVELVTVAGKSIGRATFEPGWKWSESVGPIAKTSRCEAAHYGYQISGTMKIVSAEGDYDIHAGDIFNIPAGHDAWVVGNEEVVVVDFQGMVDYAKPKATSTSERRSGTDRKH